MADCVCLGGVFRSQLPVLRCLSVFLMCTCKVWAGSVQPRPRLPGLHSDSLEAEKPAILPVFSSPEFRCNLKQDQ
ncbi:hypothetical protein CHARACLAT_012465 [Characodon lateralis]|uniref:Uncharacterized protein n=1 Tax=Characodon lateralis TaxID=208331 RepID=A0ABU7DQH5_9TELE|nr:hypothetical protein [Characodon lateralis]